MGRIHQLDNQTTNMIAAGEVVERPMGVVKELVENAIDAGSTSITISIEEGGMKKITITDNGCGMDAQDAEMAFLRHATSKIQNANDLWAIHSLGFRGEAVPSIASVSKVTLITSDGNDHTRIVVSYGNKESAGPYPCNQGTEISVEGLFYRTPARLKHMRSASYESGLIQDVINRFALSHPEIAFHLINDGRDVFRTSGQGNLQEVIYDVYGRGAAEESIAVDFSDFDYHVTGYVMKPTVTRASRNMMHLFLNGRMIKTYKLFQAVQEGYAGFLPQGRYPLCVLSIEMDPHLLDVNVHPSKWEVRISKEIQLENLLRTEIAKIFHQEEAVPKVSAPAEMPVYYEPMSFEEELKDAPPVVLPKQEAAPVIQEEVKEEPVITRDSFADEIEEDNRILRELYAQEEEVAEAEEETVPFPEMRVIGQYKKMYILAECENGIALIDVKAAQKRIETEKILHSQHETNVQLEEFVPITIHAGEEVVRTLDEVNGKLAHFQIALEPFGKDVVMLRSIPSWMKELNVEEFVTDLLDTDRQGNSLAQIKDQVMTRLVGKHLRFSYRKLTYEEMERMVEDLSKCQNPYVSIDAKPTLIMLDENDIRKDFSR